MKKESKNIVISILIIITCFYFIYTLNEKRKTIVLFHKQNNSLLLQNKFLERCLKYRSIINSSKVPILSSQKETIVYLSGKVCPSCAEQLLRTIRILGEEKNTLVLTNSYSKLDFIIGFNDIHLARFKYLMDTTNFISPQNEILVFKHRNTEIRNILEFRPEEKDIFIKYFNIFFH